MAKGRKHGCPVNIRSWLIYILDKATREWVRIYGLTSMTQTISGETSDGSSAAEVWEEPYVTKRSAELSLDGEIVEEESTGVRDPGQEMLREAALGSGCEDDITLKMIDPYGHGMTADYVVTGSEESQNDTESGISWTLQMVGEPEYLVYVQVEGVEVREKDQAVTSLNLTTGDAARILTLAFRPADASNRRFRVFNSLPGVARVSDITEDGFTLTPMKAGTTVIRVETMNGGREASVTVNVTGE
jgi:hypothetical protein